MQGSRKVCQRGSEFDKFFFFIYFFFLMREERDYNPIFL